MKKVLKHSALVLTALALVACGNSKKASDNGTASNSNFEVSVKDGMYVLPKDEDSNSHYLALQVEIKNNRDKQFSFTSHDITLYNEKDEKVEPINIYESDSKTKFMSYGDSISKGKSVAGYVVYEVDKDAKYELHFAPSFYDDVKENQKGKNDVAIKVDPSQYEDTIDEAKEAMKKYVDAVYLDGENTGGASNVSFTNDKTQIVALEDKKSDNKKSDDKKSEEKAEKTKSMEDVVAAAKKNYVNIGKVQYDSKLKFDKSKDYGISELKNAKKFKDGEFSGGKLLSEAIVNLSLGYYSGLTDKVNSGSDDVLKLINEDSELYGHVKAIAEGDEEQQIKNIKIGEIKNSGSNYYVILQITEGKANSSDTSTETKILSILNKGKELKVTAATDAE